MDKSKREVVKSRVLKCGKRTYFFDVQKASNSKNYLKITESKFMGEGEERKRNSFILFATDLQNFQENLKEMVGYMGE